MAGSSCNVGDLGWIPGLGRPPGGGNGNPLQYSCLGNPMDRGTWQVTAHGVTELDTAQHELSFMAFGNLLPPLSSVRIFIKILVLSL